MFGLEEKISNVSLFQLQNLVWLSEVQSKLVGFFRHSAALALRSYCFCYDCKAMLHKINCASFGTGFALLIHPYNVIPTMSNQY